MSVEVAPPPEPFCSPEAGPDARKRSLAGSALARLGEWVALSEHMRSERGSWYFYGALAALTSSDDVRNFLSVSSPAMDALMWKGPFEQYVDAMEPACRAFFFREVAQGPLATGLYNGLPLVNRSMVRGRYLTTSAVECLLGRLQLHALNPTAAVELILTMREQGLGSHPLLRVMGSSLLADPLWATIPPTPALHLALLGAQVGRVACAIARGADVHTEFGSRTALERCYGERMCFSAPSSSGPTELPRNTGTEMSEVVLRAGAVPSDVLRTLSARFVSQETAYFTLSCARGRRSRLLPNVGEATTVKALSLLSMKGAAAQRGCAPHGDVIVEESVGGDRDACVAGSAVGESLGSGPIPYELYWAVRKRDVAWVQQLVDGGVDVNAQYHAMSPLEAAIVLCPVPGFRVVPQAREPQSREVKWLGEVVELLVHAGADVNVCGTRVYYPFPADYVHYHGRLSRIRYHHPDGAAGRSLMWLAFEHRQVDLLRQLRAYGASLGPTAELRDALLTAMLQTFAVGGRLRDLHIRALGGAAGDERQLGDASEEMKGCVCLLSDMLDCDGGSCVREEDSLRGTPSTALLTACWLQSADAAALLIKCGADVPCRMWGRFLSPWTSTTWVVVAAVLMRDGADALRACCSTRAGERVLGEMLRLSIEKADLSFLDSVCGLALQCVGGASGVGRRGACVGPGGGVVGGSAAEGDEESAAAGSHIVSVVGCALARVSGAAAALRSYIQRCRNAGIVLPWSELMVCAIAGAAVDVVEALALCEIPPSSSGLSPGKAHRQRGSGEGGGECALPPAAEDPAAASPSLSADIQSPSVTARVPASMLVGKGLKWKLPQAGAKSEGMAVEAAEVDATAVEEMFTLVEVALMSEAPEEVVKVLVERCGARCDGEWGERVVAIAFAQRVAPSVITLLLRSGASPFGTWRGSGCLMLAVEALTLSPAWRGWCVSDGIRDRGEDTSFQRGRWFRRRVLADVAPLLGEGDGDGGAVAGEEALRPGGVLDVEGEAGGEVTSPNLRSFETSVMALRHARACRPFPLCSGVPGGLRGGEDDGALLALARSGCASAVAALLRCGVQPSCEEVAAVALACVLEGASVVGSATKDAVAVVECVGFLTRGVHALRWEVEGELPLPRATRCGAPACVVSALLAAGAGVNDVEGTVIRATTLPPSLQMMIRSAVSGRTNAASAGGRGAARERGLELRRSAFDEAAYGEDAEVCRVLLCAGARVECMITLSHARTLGMLLRVGDRAVVRRAIHRLRQFAAQFTARSEGVATFVGVGAGGGSGDGVGGDSCGSGPACESEIHFEGSGVSDRGGSGVEGTVWLDALLLDAYLSCSAQWCCPDVVREVVDAVGCVCGCAALAPLLALTDGPSVSEGAMARDGVDGAAGQCSATCVTGEPCGIRCRTLRTLAMEASAVCDCWLAHLMRRGYDDIVIECIQSRMRCSSAGAYFTQGRLCGAVRCALGWVIADGRLSSETFSDEDVPRSARQSSPMLSFGGCVKTLLMLALSLRRPRVVEALCDAVTTAVQLSIHCHQSTLRDEEGGAAEGKTRVDVAGRDSVEACAPEGVDAVSLQERVKSMLTDVLSTYEIRRSDNAYRAAREDAAERRMVLALLRGGARITQRSIQRTSLQRSCRLVHKLLVSFGVEVGCEWVDVVVTVGDELARVDGDWAWALEMLWKGVVADRVGVLAQHGRDAGKTLVQRYRLYCTAKWLQIDDQSIKVGAEDSYEGVYNALSAEHTEEAWQLLSNLPSRSYAVLKSWGECALFLVQCGLSGAVEGWLEYEKPGTAFDDHLRDILPDCFHVGLLAKVLKHGTYRCLLMHPIASFTWPEVLRTLYTASESMSKFLTRGELVGSVWERPDGVSWGGAAAVVGARYILRVIFKRLLLVVRRLPDPKGVRMLVYVMRGLQEYLREVLGTSTFAARVRASLRGEEGVGDADADMCGQEPGETRGMRVDLRPRDSAEAAFITSLRVANSLRVAGGWVTLAAMAGMVVGDVELLDLALRGGVGGDGLGMQLLCDMGGTELFGTVQLPDRVDGASACGAWLLTSMTQRAERACGAGLLRCLQRWGVVGECEVWPSRGAVETSGFSAEPLVRVLMRYLMRR